MARSATDEQVQRAIDALLEIAAEPSSSDEDRIAAANSVLSAYEDISLDSSSIDELARKLAPKVAARLKAMGEST